MNKKRFAFILVPVLIILTLLFFKYKWSALDYYIPENDIAFKTDFRTWAEHDSLMHGRKPPYIVRIDSINGAQGGLLYFGSRHTTNPDDPQIAQIETLWNEFQPTVAVTENRLGFFVGSMRMAIPIFGEFAAVSALGQEGDIPVYTLEPSWEVEVREMKAAFPAEEVTLFYTLRVFLSERGEDKSPEEIESLAEHLLGKRGSRPGLEGSLPDLAAMDDLWQRKYSHLGDWRELSPRAVWPSKNPTRLQEISNLVNAVRDRHAARVILELIAKGKRVFAVAGASHVVKQEPVLRAGPGN